MQRKRAVVFAYSSIGYECLAELLAENVEIPAVFTHQDDPEEEKWFRSVRELAEENRLPLYSPARLKEDEVRLVRELRPDLIFSFSYRTVIPLPILESASLGAFNIHGALLPRYRGRACVNWAVIHGERETGVTLHHMTARVDEGRIVDQEPVQIGEDDTAHDVFKKMIPAARAMLHRSLPAILEGAAHGWEQDESLATYFGRRRPEDGQIDWSKPARDVHNLVRAVTHPFPGAFTYLDGRKLFIWRTRLTAQAQPEGECITPGVVVSSSPLKVSTGTELIEIQQAQWSDEKESIEKLKEKLREDFREKLKGDELRLPVGVTLTGP
ncbi:MAG: formyltransferase [Synergistaceae bacterium]|jgi:methionyl-tRNA formyltransferase|nr:formyltransferase [Synergistaceae bacterium]